MSTTIGSFIAGGIAACGAVTVTHSFETIKIRLQLQGELQTKKDAPRMYKGVVHGVKVVVQNEGIRGLLRGLSCAVSHTLVANDRKIAGRHHTHALAVYLPNDPQWLPSRLLRAPATQRELVGPYALAHEHHRPSRTKPPIAARQHLLRRGIRHSRRSSTLR